MTTLREKFEHVASMVYDGGKIILISTPTGATKLIGQLKDKKIYHIIDGQYETIDWRNMKLLTRIKIAFAIVIYGRLKIKWKRLIIK